MRKITLILFIIIMTLGSSFAGVWEISPFEDLGIDSDEWTVAGLNKGMAILNMNEDDPYEVWRNGVRYDITRLREEDGYVSDFSYLYYDENGQSEHYLIPEYIAFLQSHMEAGINPEEYLAAREKFLPLFTYPQWVTTNDFYLDDNFESHYYEENHYIFPRYNDSLLGLSCLLRLWAELNPDRVDDFQGGGFSPIAIGGGLVAGLIAIGTISNQRKKKKLKKKKKVDQNKKPPEEEDDQDKDLKLKGTVRNTLRLMDNHHCEGEFFVVGDQKSKWRFSVQNAPLKVEIKQKSNSRMALICYSNRGLLTAEEDMKVFKLLIQADNGKQKLNKTFEVTVVREGMRCLSARPLEIIADGVTETELKFTAIVFFEKRFHTDYALLRNIEFALHCDDKIDQNAFAISEIDFHVLAEFEDVRAAIDNQGKVFGKITYKLKTKRALTSRTKDKDQPLDYKGRLKVTAEAHGDHYEEDFEIILKPPAEPPLSEQIEKEIEITLMIIDRYVLDEHKERFRKQLELYKDIWGPKGIHTFRHRIWNITQKQIEAHGLEGYKKMLQDIETYDEVRFWVEWAGDLALDGVLMVYLGFSPLGTAKQIMITMLKQTMVSIMKDIRSKFEEYGKYTAEDFERWKDQETYQLMVSTPDHVISAASIRGMLTGGKALAYTFGVVFLRSLFMGIDWEKWGEKWENDPYINPNEVAVDLTIAAKMACKEVFKCMTMVALSSFLSAAMIRSAVKHQGKHPIKIHPDVYGQGAKHILSEKNIPQRSKKLYVHKDLPDTMPAKKLMLEVDSTGQVSFKTMMENWSDNTYNSMRTLKSVDAKYQKAFMKTYKRLKAKRKDYLVKELRKMKNVPWEDCDIDVVSMSHSKFSQDDDFRAVYTDKHGQVLEISARHWVDKAKQWWKSETGYDADLCQQVGMTRHGDEAFSGFQTQILSKKDGRYVNVEPSIFEVYAGKKKLDDGIGYGAVYFNKVKNSTSPHESLAQAAKFVTSFKKVMKSHQKQGFNTPPVDANLQLAMHLIENVSPSFEFNSSVQSKFNNILRKETGYSSTLDMVRAMTGICGKL